MTEEIEIKQIDRTGWDPGPWDNEPDRVDFEHAGFPCLILRVDSGHLCGYVGLPPEHPLHGVDYNTPSEALRGALAKRMDQPVGDAPSFSVLLSCALGADVEPTPDTALTVHGGITYASKCSGRICHVPSDGQPADIWWLGFDCHHYGDWAPGNTKMWRDLGHHEWTQPARGEQYRTVEYVRGECERLAEQLRELAP